MGSDQQLVLYSYFRSSASWRVRIALEWKGIKYDYKGVNLVTSANTEDDYTKINPTQKVPALITKEGDILSQSQAIFEYLEEVYPDRPLLPKTPLQRAQIREICQIIACDIHPIQNLGVLKRIAGDDQAKRAQWAKESVELGFKGLEAVLKKTAGTYSVGDSVTMADLFVVPMVGNAKRWEVDMSAYPTISRINDACSKLPEFIAAAPTNQPDCPAELKK